MSTGGYDPIEDMVKVKSVQKKWRDSFTGTDLNPGKWTQQLGSGASLGVAGGVLTMGSGVVAGAESWVLSTEVFTIPFRVSIALTLSQRIANQGCPSSNDVRLIGGLCNGVSGPSAVEVKLRFGDASSGAAGWFCA
jgi:hypothetical protein